MKPTVSGIVGVFASYGLAATVALSGTLARAVDPAGGSRTSGQRPVIAVSMKQPPRTVVGTPDMTDDDLVDILKAASDVRTLDLDRCIDLTDKCLPHIANLPELRSLRLPGTSHITVEGCCGALKNLSLDEIIVPRFVYSDPRGFALRNKIIKDLPELDLTDADQAAEKLMAISGRTGLRTLVLSKAGMTDEALRTLKTFPDLEAVTVFVGGAITDAGIASIGDCSGLRALSLVDARPSSERKPCLSARALEGLKALKLMHFEVPPWMRQEDWLGLYLAALAANAPDKDTIHLGTDPMDEPWPASKASISAIRDHGGVKKVYVGWFHQPEPPAQITDDVLAMLGGAKGLEELHLTGLDIDGKCFQEIAKCSSLRVVHFRKCPRLTDEALLSLSDCRRLWGLLISECPNISDAAVMKLVECESLKHLDVGRTKARPVTKVKFQTIRPDCQVNISQ